MINWLKKLSRKNTAGLVTSAGKLELARKKLERARGNVSQLSYDRSVEHVEQLDYAMGFFVDFKVPMNTEDIKAVYEVVSILWDVSSQLSKYHDVITNAYLEALTKLNESIS